MLIISLITQYIKNINPVILSASTEEIIHTKSSTLHQPLLHWDGILLTTFTCNKLVWTQALLCHLWWKEIGYPPHQKMSCTNNLHNKSNCLQNAKYTISTFSTSILYLPFFSVSAPLVPWCFHPGLLQRSATTERRQSVLVWKKSLLSLR